MYVCMYVQVYAACIVQYVWYVCTHVCMYLYVAYMYVWCGGMYDMYVCMVCMHLTYDMRRYMYA